MRDIYSYINELEHEIEEYRAIGTAEEWWKSRERRNPILETIMEDKGNVVLRADAFIAQRQNIVRNAVNPFCMRMVKMTYQRADSKNPFMGLDNKICRNPVYWCRLHQVWLSEDDVERKKCKCKPTFDMIGTYRCLCLERKEEKNERME